MTSNSVEVLVITTPWCHHCRAIRPGLDRLELTYSSSMRVQRIDATLEPDRVKSLGVQATPTIIMMVDGTERARLIGRVTDHDLEEFFRNTGDHRPFPLDGITRSLAGAALMGVGLWLDTLVLLVTGVALAAWAAVTFTRTAQTAPATSARNEAS